MTNKRGDSTLSARAWELRRSPGVPIVAEGFVFALAWNINRRTKPGHILLWMAGVDNRPIRAAVSDQGAGLKLAGRIDKGTHSA